MAGPSASTVNKTQAQASDKNNVSKRVSELQSKGMDRALASQLANAEAKGQKVTNLSPDQAKSIEKAGGSKAIINKEIESTKIVEKDNPQNTGGAIHENRAAVVQAKQKIAEGKELTASEQFVLATGIKPKSVDSLNQAIGLAASSKENQEIIKSNINSVEQYNQDAKDYQESLRQQREEQNSLPMETSTTTKYSDKKLTAVSEKWAERLVRKEEQVNKLHEQTLGSIWKGGLREQEADKFISKVGIGIARNFVYSFDPRAWFASGQSLILTGEKALFLGYSSGAALFDKNLRATVTAERMEMSKGTMQQFNPTTPEGVTNLLTVSAGAALSTGLSSPKATTTAVKVGKGVASRVAEGAAKTGGAIDVVLTKSTPGKRGAVFRGGKRVSPMSKTQMRRQSAGLPINKQGGVKFNQGEFVQKAPKRNGVQESLRYNPSSQEFKAVQKTRNAKATTTFNQKGEIVQRDLQVGRGEALTQKPYSRPASQVKTAQYRQAEKVGYEVVSTKIGNTQLQQTMQMLKTQKYTLQKNPKQVEARPIELKITNSGGSQPHITKAIGVKETPISNSKINPRESVRQKLIEKALEKQRTIKNAQNKVKGSQVKDFDSKVDMTGMFDDLQKRSLPTAIEKFNSKGVVDDYTPYSTQNTMPDGAYVVTTGENINPRKLPLSQRHYGRPQSHPHFSNIHNTNFKEGPFDFTNVKGSSSNNVVVVQGHEEIAAAAQGGSISFRSETNALSGIGSNYKTSGSQGTYQGKIIDIVPDKKIMPALVQKVNIRNDVRQVQTLTNDLGSSNTLKPSLNISSAVVGNDVKNLNQVDISIKKSQQQDRKHTHTRSLVNESKIKIEVPQNIIKPTISQFTPRRSPRQIPKKQVLPVPFKPKLNFDNNNKKKPGYDVYTRVQGKWRKINAEPLPHDQAINFGAVKVGNTSAASFKVQISGEQKGSFLGKGILADFYKKGNVFIEKASRRIKSSGEKQEITFKGIFASKRKRRK